MTSAQSGRELKLPVSIDSIHKEGRRSITVDFGEVHSDKWLHELALLRTGKSRRLSVRQEDSNRSVSINRAEDGAEGARVLARSVSDSSTIVEMPSQSIAAIEGFFLTRYRDGAAPVSHIDLEVYWPEHEKVGYLTFLVSDHVPPMSGDEAARVLRGKD